MSTTKIIKGWVSPGQARRSSDGYDGGIVRLNVYGPDEPNEGCDIYDYDEPATLYIGTGKLWTEDEVQAALSRKDAEIEALRNPWISVHDRLPENDDTVFVMLDYYQADMDGPDVVGLSSSGEYDTGSLFDGAVLADHFNDDDVDVTHWMPLPSQTKP